MRAQSERFERLAMRRVEMETKDDLDGSGEGSSRKGDGSQGDFFEPVLRRPFILCSIAEKTVALGFRNFQKKKKKI